MNNDIIIDETIPTEDGTVDGVVIDATDESGSVNRVDLSNLVATTQYKFHAAVYLYHL